MTQISPLPGKVVVAAPTGSSGSVSEISTNISSAVSSANVRYQQKKAHKWAMDAMHMQDGMFKFNRHDVTLSSQI